MNIKLKTYKLVSPTNFFLLAIHGLGLAFLPLCAIAADDPVLAKVDDYEIHLSEVEEARTLLPPALQQQGGTDVIALLVETIIDTKLAAKRGKEQGLDKTDEYKKTISRIEGQILKRMLFADEIKKGITEEGIKKYFDEFVKDKPLGDEVHARHILLESEDKAKEIIKKLNEGADFNATAMENSIGPSAPTGGDLGWFVEGAMVPEFEKEAFSLAVGEHSKNAVKSRFGWHIIKVEGKRKAKSPTIDEAREEIVRQLSSEIGQKLLDSLRKDAKIERYELSSQKN